MLTTDQHNLAMAMFNQTPERETDAEYNARFSRIEFAMRELFGAGRGVHSVNYPNSDASHFYNLAHQRYITDVAAETYAEYQTAYAANAARIEWDNAAEMAAADRATCAHLAGEYDAKTVFEFCRQTGADIYFACALVLLVA